MSALEGFKEQKEEEKESPSRGFWNKALHCPLLLGCPRKELKYADHIHRVRQR